MISSRHLCWMWNYHFLNLSYLWSKKFAVALLVLYLNFFLWHSLSSLLKCLSYNLMKKGKSRTEERHWKMAMERIRKILFKYSDGERLTFSSATIFIKVSFFATFKNIGYNTSLKWFLRLLINFKCSYH